MPDMKWLTYAILSAIAAAFVGILGKVGMRDVDSTLATCIRSVVMTIFLVSVCLISGIAHKLQTIPQRAMGIIVLSGIAGAVSWLFYFRAIQLGTVSQVAPIDKLSMPLTVLLAVILLKERPTWENWVGIALIVAGAFLAAMSRSR